jgi:Phage P2 GpE
MKSKKTPNAAAPAPKKTNLTIKVSESALNELADLTTIFHLPMAQLASAAIREIAPIWRERGTINVKAA